MRRTSGNGNAAKHLEQDSGDTKNKYMTQRHSPHLQGELNAHTANDYGFNKSEAHFNPGLARTNVAATPEHPQGTTQDEWNIKHKDLTVMQQHCVYWDADGDGIIWPQDTYNGCRAWGWNPILCAIAVFLINGNLSWPTGTSWLPDPFFRIHINRIHHDKHGSDSMTYDNQGRFRPHAFEEFFDNYDRGDKGGLNAGDIYQAWLGQRLVFDGFGWSAFFFECMSTRHKCVWRLTNSI
jgi:peroxygenase